MLAGHLPSLLVGTLGLVLLGGALMAALDSRTATAIGALLIVVLLALPGVYFILAFRPLPPGLYPRWAREALTWRTQANAGPDAWSAERRSQR